MGEAEKTKSTPVAALTKQVEALRARVVASQVVEMPAWPESKRGTPNSFLRSALFAAIHSRDREFLNGVTLASQKNVFVKFTGEQLNQEDLSVWEALAHLARQSPLGDTCFFSAYSLLKSLDQHTGSSQHTLLHKSIIRLVGGVVEIKQDGITYIGQLIQEAMRDDATGRYAVKLNTRLAALFGENQWTAVDWRQRQALRKKPLAQALHAFYSSHRRPFDLKIDSLREYVGSQNQRRASFRSKVAAALQELVKINFLSDFSIENDLVSVTRAEPDRQGSLFDDGSLLNEHNFPVGRRLATPMAQRGRIKAK